MDDRQCGITLHTQQADVPVGLQGLMSYAANPVPVRIKFPGHKPNEGQILYRIFSNVPDGSVSVVYVVEWSDNSEVEVLFEGEMHDGGYDMQTQGAWMPFSDATMLKLYSGPLA